jgi:hypothetical protein
VCPAHQAGQPWWPWVNGKRFPDTKRFKGRPHRPRWGPVTRNWTLRQLASTLLP